MIKESETNWKGDATIKVISESSHKFVGDLTTTINGFSKTAFSRQNKSPDKTSLTSWDTRKESENQSVTKTYSVRFSRRVELLHNKSNGSSLSKDTLCEKSQAIWLGNQILGPKLKNQPVKLLEMTESIYYFKGSLLILLGKPTHNAYLTIGIPFGMPRSTWCKLMNLSMINHKQKINFRPDLILEI